MLMNLLKRPDLLIGVIFLSSLTLILTALGYQHIGGLAPCDLCYKQRWVYYIAIAVLPLSLFLYGRDQILATRILLLVMAVAFFTNMGLGIYHSGVEWKFWAGPSGCSGGNLEQLDATINLIDALKEAKPVPCGDPQWRLLGISMAGYSALASLGLAIVSFWSAHLLRAKS